MAREVVSRTEGIAFRRSWRHRIVARGKKEIAMTSQEAYSSSEVPERSGDDVSTRGEQRERLYESVERKIDIARDIWLAAEGLEPPRAGDDDAAIRAERAALERPLENIYRQFPGARGLTERYQSLYVRLNQLEDEMQHTEAEERTNAVYIANEPVEDEMEKIREQLRTLEDDDNFLFVRTVSRGITAALETRQSMRDILRRLGPRAGDPAAYEEELPEEHREQFRRSIVAVSPERFSFIVDIGRDGFRRLGPRYKDASGIHVAPCWSLINRTMLDGQNLMAGIFGDEHEMKRWQHQPAITAKHEDFHAFFQGFAEKQGFFSVQRINRQADQLLRLKEIQAPKAVIDHELQIFARRARTFQDYGHEELLAELASAPHEVIPNSTYAAEMGKTEALLHGLKGRDPDLDRIIDQEIKNLDVSRIRERFQRLYETVREKAPERLLDLDIALAIFPPSKMRHVERLVERWVPHGLERDQSGGGREDGPEPLP